MRFLILFVLSACTFHNIPKKGVCFLFENQDELTKEFKSSAKCDVRILAKIVRNKTVSLYSESTDVLRNLLELRIDYKIFQETEILDSGTMTERVSMNIIHSPFESFINEDIEYKNLAQVLYQRLYYHALAK